MPFQYAGVSQFDGKVEARLSAQRGQDSIRPLPFDDSFKDGHVQRLDVNVVRNVLVGHDGCRVRIDQDDLDAFFTQCLAGLRPGIVELSGLTYDDRT